MILIGMGQGGALGPPTAAGVVGVTGEDAGAASGPVNVAHQLGGSLGVLVTMFAAAGSASLDARDLLAGRVSAALTGGSVMLALAFIVVIALIVWSRPAPADGRAGELTPRNRAAAPTGASAAAGCGL